jgi:anti-sigma factor (TIGR02949 family)
MSCGEARWLHGYFDGELDAARAAEFEAHLEGCPACARALAAQQSLRTALATAGLYAKAPAGLRARLRTALPGSAAPRRAPWRSLGVAASLMLAFLGVWWTVPAWRADVAERELVGQVMDAHLRSLQLAHLTDVASTDQHTVKPWFVGKLDFAPVVVDLAPDGFPLAGGRLDVVGGRSVAALVYTRRKHVINLFVWPVDGPDAAVEAGTRRGYAWVRWKKGGMRFWAASDVAAPDLQEFARLLSPS